MRMWRGLTAGLLGGMIASGLMSVVHKRLSRQQSPPAEQEPDDDATVKVAAGITRSLFHHPLTDDKKPFAGTVIHYAFGASVGAVYGAIADVVPRATAVRGLPFGLAVWLGAHVITIPALGLAEPVTRQPRSKEALELLLHLIYGAVTEVARRFVRPAL